MGFPIRKSTGHRLFAPHRSLSQRTTSFIASCRQGIHRMLLGHLIALISNAHLRKAGVCKRLAGAHSFLLLLGMVNTAYRKTSLHRDRPDLEPAVQRARSHGIGLARRGACTAQRMPTPRDDADECPAPRAYPFFTMSRKPPLRRGGNTTLQRWTFQSLSEVWWSQTGSNRRPPACKAGALPTELWPLQVTGTRGQGSG